MAEHTGQPNEGDLGKLDDELVEGISGGYIHEYGDDDWFEVIDNRTGKALDDGWRNNEFLLECCEKHGVSTKEISDKELEKLRMYAKLGIAGKR